MYSLQSAKKELHLRKASFAVRALGGSEGIAARLLGPVTSGNSWAAPAARPPGGARRVKRGRTLLSQLRLENTLAGRLQVLQGLEDFPLLAQGLLKQSLT